MKTPIFIFAMLSSLILSGQNTSYNIVTNPEVENSDAYRNGNSYQRDFLLFADMFEHTHPIFAETGSEHYDMDSLTRAGYQYLVSCESDGQLKQHLQSILSPLNDGHSGVMMDFHGKIFPFKYFADSDTAFYLIGITRDFSNELGHRILSINGKPVGEVVESFRASMSCDNNNYFMANVNNYMQMESAWEYNPYKRKDGNLLLQFGDGISILLPPVEKTNIDMNWYYPSKKNVPDFDRDAPFCYKLMHDESICYFRFATCIDRNTLRAYERMGMSIGMSEEQIGQLPDFRMFLQDMFGEINRSGIKTLVVDIRDNGGGNSLLCDQLLSWLKPYGEIKHGTGKMRVSKLWESQYPNLMKSFKVNLQEKGIPFHLGELYDSELVENETDLMLADLFPMNHDSDSIFDGEVVFIQGSGTFSSAGDLVTTAIDNGIGIVIGGNSIYSPSGYGDLLYWELPNTHIQGFVSHKIFMRPDATKHNENAIIPDIPLPDIWADYRNGIDPCWKWVLDNYGDK